MIVMRKFLIFLSFSFVGPFLGETARTKEKIYVTLEGYGGCFRRLNATHQIGCNSDRSGNVGVLYFVQNSADLSWLLDSGPHSPYVVFLTSSMFDGPNVREVVQSGKASGIITSNTVEDEFPTEFSPDDSCPNHREEYYGDKTDYAGCNKVKWNKAGNSLFYEDYNIPIMVLSNHTEVQDLFEDCLDRNSRRSDGTAPDYPLCGAEVKDVMDAAVDTPTCMRRSNLVTNLSPQTYCDPMGDYNVYSLMQPVKSDEKEAKFLVAATRMDSFSMFDGVYPSADSAISGLVTLLATAQALSKFKEEFKEADKKLIFMFFNGEAFEYMGSGRMVYDMKQDKFPSPREKGQVTPQLIKPENIEAFIELAQVGKLDDGKLWLHTDPVSRQNITVNDKVEALLTDIQNHPGVDIDLSEVPADQPLPPASLQSFLKHSQVPGVVITDHQQNYTNTYYNSMYDVPSNIDLVYPDDSDKYNYISDAAKQLTKVAEVMARTLYRQAGLNESLDSITVNDKDVANLLYCFAHDPICELFNKTIDPYYSKLITKAGFSYYVGVGISGTSINYVRHMTKQLLSYFLGERVTLKKDTCREEDFKDGDNADYDRCCKNLKAHTDDRIYKYVYINDEGESDGSIKCIKSLVNVSVAKSPAFDIEGYDWETNKYPAWSESRWGTDAISFRYFLIPPKSMEVTALVVGLVLLLCSFPIVYFINKQASVLFDDGGLL